MSLSPEAQKLSADLARALGQLPEQVSPTRWKFTAQTDRSEPFHYVDYMAGRLYCTCTGFSVHKHCKHADQLKELLMNDEEYPMTREMVPAASFGGAVAVHRSPTELRHRLEEMKAERGLVAAFMKDVMEPSTPGTTDGDYGIIPGTDKPTLFKPGAEKLCELYGYAPTIKDREELRDNETGHYRVVVTIALVQKGTGAVVAEGIGECNTREARYFYRWMPEWELRKIPELYEIRNNFKKQEFEYTPKTGQNAGRKQKSIRYRVENDDLFTLWNTVLKMAKKRALVDAVLSATRSSGIFSQSMDNLNDWIEAEYTDLTESLEHEETQQAGETGPTERHSAPPPSEVVPQDAPSQRGPAASSPACDHRDASYDDTTTLLTCNTCGAVLEEPPSDAPKQRQLVK